MQIGGRVASPNRGYHEAARILISAGNKINHAPIALAWGEGGGVPLWRKALKSPAEILNGESARFFGR